MDNDSVSIPSISSVGGSSDTDSSLSSMSNNMVGGEQLSAQKNGLGANQALALGASGSSSNNTDAISALLISQCISKVNNICKCFDLKGCNDSKIFSGGGSDNEQQNGGNIDNFLALSMLANNGLAHGNPGAARGNPNALQQGSLLNQAVLLKALSGNNDNDNDNNNNDNGGIGNLAKLSLLQPGLLGNNGSPGAAFGAPGGMGGSSQLLISIMNLNEGLSKLKTVLCDDAMTTFVKKLTSLAQTKAEVINDQFNGDDNKVLLELKTLLKKHGEEGTKSGGKRRGRRPACKNSKKKSSCNRRKNCNWSKSHKRKGSKKRVSGSCRKMSKGKGKGRGRRRSK